MSTTVTASSPSLEDPNQTFAEATTVEDNYVVICDGTAHVDGITVHRRKDGTETHIITVKGCKP